MANESIISVIDAEIATLRQARALLASGGNVGGVTRTGRPKKAAAKKAVKRTLSPEARARIAEAQRKRWAATKKVNPATPPNAMKRTLSPEARQRIAEAQRKRWAATKKLAELSAVSKKSKKAAKKVAKKATPKRAAKAISSVAVPEAPKAEIAS